MKVVTAEEMRAIEQRAAANGTSLDALMQRAGVAVARVAAEAAQGRPVVILAGPGNNGGDGVVAARELAAQGIAIHLYTFRRNEEGLPTTRSENDPEQTALRQLLLSAGVVVDALLGTGQTRPVEGLLAEIVERANERPAAVAGVAVDIPTGVDADTGSILGTAFRADTTVVMGFLKIGDVVYPGAGMAGQIRLAPIGLSSALAESSMVSVPDDADIALLLPRHAQNSNKGSFGRLLVVSGSVAFQGAPALSSIAAYRAGAGLVQVATVPGARRSVAAHTLEPIFLEVPHRNGRIAADAVHQIGEAMDTARALLLGPGLGLSPDTKELVQAILKQLPLHHIPAIFDADALNALSQSGEWWPVHSPLVITPHPGEMSRLVGASVDDIQRNRLAVARDHARRWNVVVVLKGAGTIVAAPDGRISINPTGGPNLATAGTGDVLSGIIGGLLAQGAPPFEAAVAAAYLHGRAGDILQAEHGDAGTVASDLLPILPSARLSILEGASAT